jgi:hypothetical protein
MDSLPEDNVGFWIAKKISRNLNEPEGLIPNQQKAEQIIIKQRLLSQGGDKQRGGGSLMRSFRRSKSVDRSGSQSSGKDSPVSRGSLESSNIVTYERVIQKSSPIKRPVVLMGLFCDVVCSKLAKDSPGIFELPNIEVEKRGNPGEEFTSSLLNVGVIRGIMNRGRHCLMVISPRAVQFLRDKTEVNPLVIYLSPVSKNVLKAIQHQLAPTTSDKKPSFLLEEAGKFEKYHSGLFDAIVPYKVDGTWLGLLKDTVDRFQRHPQWITYEEEDRYLEHGGSSPDLVKTTRIGGQPDSKDQTRQHRVSHTTDDIPDQIQDLLSRHTNLDLRSNQQTTVLGGVHSQGVDFCTDGININGDSNKVNNSKITNCRSPGPPKSILKNMHNSSLSAITLIWTV